MPSSCRQPIFGAFRDQASDVILTGIPEQRSAKTRDRRTSDQPESGKHDKVLQMFSINVNLLTNLPMGPVRGKNWPSRIQSFPDRGGLPCGGENSLLDFTPSRSNPSPHHGPTGSKLHIWAL